MELLLLRAGCFFFDGNSRSWNRKASGEQVVKSAFSTVFSWYFSDLGKFLLFESGEKILHGVEVIKGWFLGIHFHFFLNFLWSLHIGGE